MSGGESFLKGRVAVVSGGGSGQGRAIALALAGAGARVAIGSYLADRLAGDDGEATYYPGQDELDAVCRAIEACGTKAHGAHLDVRDADSVAAFWADAEAALGPADILVNAAGITAEQPVAGHPETLWLKVIDTNLNGAFRMTRAALPGMIARGWGRVINIASTAASNGWKDNPAYCASKSGLLGLTRCVGLEGAPHGVTCNAISPGWVRTGLMDADIAQIAEAEGAGRSAAEVMAEFAASNPQKRILEPEEIAALALWLCRDEARGVTTENITLSAGAVW